MLRFQDKFEKASGSLFFVRAAAAPLAAIRFAALIAAAAAFASYFFYFTINQQRNASDCENQNDCRNKFSHDIHFLPYNCNRKHCAAAGFLHGH